MQYKLGKQVFISYRGADYGLAQQASQWLLQQRYCEKVYTYEPNSLTAPGEVLPIYKYFELVETISDHMYQRDSFIYIETDTYWSSFFTQMEQLYWSYFKHKKPIIYRFFLQGGRLFFDETPIELEHMSEGERYMWTSISRYANRRKRIESRLPVLPPGKYAEQFHLICCAACGEYLLISNKIVDIALKSHRKLSCPHNIAHMGSREIGFKQGLYRGALSRELANIIGVIPTVQDQDGRAPARRISINELLTLLATENPPPAHIPVFLLEDEKLYKHFAKISAAVTRISWPNHKDIVLFANS